MRAHTRDLSLKVQKFAVCVKRKRKDDCGATLLPPVFSELIVVTLGKRSVF